MAELESRKPAAPVEIARDEFASRADVSYWLSSIVWPLDWATI